jgi:hypothetical protein
VSGAEYYEPDAKLSSVEHGGIREQHRAQSEEQGDILEPNGASSVEHRAICVRCGTQVLRMEQSVSGTRAQSVRVRSNP